MSVYVRSGYSIQVRTFENMILHDGKEDQRI